MLCESVMSSKDQTQLNLCLIYEGYVWYYNIPRIVSIYFLVVCLQSLLDK